MLQQVSLQGLTTAHLEQLRTQIALQFFADETTDTDREEMCKFDDVVMNCIPHSFVLASLFDVEAMSLEIPEHVYESDPSLEWVTCPCCDGEKWLEVEGNVWVKALFSDHRRAYAHRHLNSSYKKLGAKQLKLPTATVTNSSFTRKAFCSSWLSSKTVRLRR
jgi:hypothetical protein